jgi:hypothetical protein
VWRASDGVIEGRDLGSARYLLSRIAQAVLIATFVAGLLSLVSICGNALRDPRYLDGWLLAGGMSLQLGFHIAIKTNRLSPKSFMRWRKIHIFIGYLLIAVFLSHSDFSLPDTAFEWALWAGVMLVMLSGIFGGYLNWSSEAKGLIDARVGADRIRIRLSEIARDAHDLVATLDPPAQIGLPLPPYNAWIADLYTNHLREFFAGPRHVWPHLIGSQKPLKFLTNEIENLSRFVDGESQEKLSAIQDLVIEKDRLDAARVHFALSKAWLFVHVPATYALIVLVLLHIVVVYSFSSGA